MDELSTALAIGHCRSFLLLYNLVMSKYEITKEVVETVKQELIRVNVPVQTLIGIEQALIKTPIVEKVEEPKTK